MAEVLRSAVIASNWWAKKICDTANLANYDIGIPKSTTGDLISLLGALNATTSTPTPEQVDTFKKSLQEIIIRELSKSHEFALSCDYQPDCFLQEAADKSGIDKSVFPFNRTMKVSIDKVYVSDGYRKPFIELNDT